MKLIHSGVQRGRGEHTTDAAKERRWGTPLADGIKLIGTKIGLAVSSICLLGALTFSCSQNERKAIMLIDDGINYPKDVQTHDKKEKDEKSRCDSTEWDTGIDAVDVFVMNDIIDAAARPDAKKDADKETFADIVPDAASDSCLDAQPDAIPEITSDAASDVQKELATDAGKNVDSQADETGNQEITTDLAEETAALDGDATDLTDSMSIDIPAIPGDVQDTADGETNETDSVDADAQELVDATDDTEETSVLDETEAVIPKWYAPWEKCVTLLINGEFPESYTHKPDLAALLGVTIEGSDLRFFEGDCVTPGKALGHWIESADPLTVWVMTKTANATSLAVLYGNPVAENTSDINKAVLFGDDFNGDTLDIAKWIMHSWVIPLKMSFANGKMNVDGYPSGYNHLESTVSTTDTESLEIMVKFMRLEGGLMGPATIAHGHFSSKADDKVLVTLYPNKLILHRYLGNKWLEIASAPITPNTNEWYLQAHTWDGTTHFAKVFRYADGQELAAVSGPCTEITQGKIGIEIDMVKALVDWFAVRKAIANEPVYLMGP